MTSAKRTEARELLLRAVFRTYRYLPIAETRIVQHKEYIWGINLKNIGSKPFGGGSLQNFRIENSGSGISWSSNKTFMAPSLNPSQETIVWGHRFCVNFEGDSLVAVSVKANDENITVITHQLEAGESVTFPNNENEWCDAMHIESVFESQQRKTNRLLVLPTSFLVLKAAIDWLIR